MLCLNCIYYAKESSLFLSHHINDFRLLGSIQNLLYLIVFIFLAGFVLNKALNIYEKNSIKPFGSFVELSERYRVNYWCEGPQR